MQKDKKGKIARSKRSFNQSKSLRLRCIHKLYYEQESSAEMRMIMLGKNKTTSSSGDANIKVNTVIGEGTVFNGNFTAPETIRVDGTVNGNCSCEKKLILGAPGKIKGNITAHDLVLSGQVEGDITAAGKLELLSTGKIIGNIIARSLVIDENAHFDGRCTMAVDAQEKKTNSPKDNEPKKEPAENKNK